MKSLKYFLLLISISSISFAQEMSVKSFEKLERDMSGRTSNVKDINGDLCALLKVVTTEKGFEFGGCNIEKTEQKTSEIWVFVSPGVRFITIRHEKFGLIRNYKFPETISPGNVYQMTLLTKDKITPIDSTHISNIIDSKMENMMQLLDERLPNKNTTIETTPTIKTEEPKQKKKIDNSPRYRPTGGYLSIATGIPMLASVAYKYQKTPSFSMGVGLGIGDYYGPFFIETTFRTPRYDRSIFFDVKLGIDIFRIYGGIDFPEDMILHSSIGMTLKRTSFGIGISLPDSLFDLDYLSIFLSYDIPIKSIKKALF